MYRINEYAHRRWYETADDAAAFESRNDRCVSRSAKWDNGLSMYFQDDYGNAVAVVATQSHI